MLRTVGLLLFVLFSPANAPPTKVCDAFLQRVIQPRKGFLHSIDDAINLTSTKNCRYIYEHEEITPQEELLCAVTIYNRFLLF